MRNGIDNCQEIPPSLHYKRSYHDSWKKVHTLSLQFCWHIRVGFFREVELSKMTGYFQFFYSHFFKEFLGMQEELLKLSGLKDPLRKKIVARQRRLRKIFSDNEGARSLSMVEDCLEDYVRTEQKFLMSSQQVRQEILKGGLLHRYSGLLENYENQLKRWGDKYWELQ